MQLEIGESFLTKRICRDQLISIFLEHFVITSTLACVVFFNKTKFEKNLKIFV